MKYNIVFLGSGPGGYMGALYAARNGMKAAVIEGDMLGGTCLNRGCIPTKAMLASTKLFYLREKAARLGWNIPDVSLDWERIKVRRQEVPDKLRKGIEYLFKKQGIDFYKGFGRLKNEHEIGIDGSDKVIEFDNIVLSTGASPKELPGVKLDGVNILTSTDLLSLDFIPHSLIIIGAGAIGMEFATIYHALGTEVVIIEYLDEILPLFDRGLAKRLRLIYKKRGIAIHTGSKVIDSAVDCEGIEISIADKEGICGHIALLAVGVVPNTKGIGLENLSIELTKAGFIKVNEDYSTLLPNIFAVGDCIGGMQLAHKASFEARLVVDKILGKKISLLPPIPATAYTEPEFSMIGLTEEACKERNIDYSIGQFPYLALGRAVAEEESEGLSKIIIDNKTREIIGGHVLGLHADLLIQILAKTMQDKGTIEDFTDQIFAHPTYAEILEESALDSIKMALHKI
jgi:dihydrolipoamide dehydrogenase